MSDQPLISRTDMMSTPYWSSPIAKLMNWVGTAAPAVVLLGPHSTGAIRRASTLTAAAWLLIIHGPLTSGWRAQRQSAAFSRMQGKSRNEQGNPAGVRLPSQPRTILKIGLNNYRRVY